MQQVSRRLTDGFLPAPSVKPFRTGIPISNLALTKSKNRVVCQIQNPGLFHYLSGFSLQLGRASFDPLFKLLMDSSQLFFGRYAVGDIKRRAPHESLAFAVNYGKL